MLVALALLVQAAAAPAPDDANTVVVTAPSQAIRSAWERCVAGGCTPRQDVVASIRQAEIQFRAGRYLDARHVLQDAITRDKGAAAAEPVAIAALYEATATISLHEGDQDVARHASGSRLGVLRAAFGERDPRYLQAQLDAIDIAVALQPRGEAVSRYAALERAARAAGQPSVAAAAALRQAEWQHAAGDDTKARRELEALRARSDGDAATGRAIEAALARLSTNRDGRKTDPATPAVAGSAAAQPTLVYQPPIPERADGDGDADVDARSSSADGQNHVVGTTAREANVIRWADIGFQVEADGRVSDVAIRRGGGGTAWAKPILAAIAKRQYVATNLPQAARYRIERWTLTADYGVETGSLIRRRGARQHLVHIDVTSTEPTRVVPATRGN